MRAAIVAGAAIPTASCNTLHGLGLDIRAAAQAIGSLTSQGERPAELQVMKPEEFTSEVLVEGGVFTSTSSLGNVYVDQPIVSGKRYWEVRVLCGPISPGVTNDISTPLSFGGYSQRNAGVYTWFATPWPKGALAEGRLNVSVPTDVWRSASNPLRITASGTVVGFALDADAGTLATYWDGRQGPTLKLSFPGPYYAHSGSQAGYAIPTGQPCKTLPPEGPLAISNGAPASGEFLLTRKTTKYPAPTGYRHLGE